VLLTLIILTIPVYIPVVGELPQIRYPIDNIPNKKKNAITDNLIRSFEEDFIYTPHF